VQSQRRVVLGPGRPAHAPDARRSAVDHSRSARANVAPDALEARFAPPSAYTRRRSSHRGNGRIRGHVVDLAPAGLVRRDAPKLCHLLEHARHDTWLGPAALACPVPSRWAPSSALLIGFGTTIQMSLLSALLPLAPRPLFESHFGATWPWGLSPLEDQQLGGAIMWALGGTLFTVIGVLAFGTWLKSLSMDEITGPAARAPDLREMNAASSRSNANTDVRQPCRGSAASGCGP
jgi:hypothetical protein